MDIYILKNEDAMIDRGIDIYKLDRCENADTDISPIIIIMPIPFVSIHLFILITISEIFLSQEGEKLLL